MPMPTFPQIDPPLTREGSINGIISSIAAEELSLSHILNTQGEKLQYVLGTLPGLEKAADLEEVMKINKSVQDTMSDVMEQQMLLTAKLSAAMKAPVYPGPTGTPIPLPDAQLLSPEITVSPDNTVFTVSKSGIYLITYHVNITAALKMGTRLMYNNVRMEDSVIAPLASLSSFECRILRTLHAGIPLSLQMYTDTIGGATLMSDGVGASLSLVRLSD